MFFERPQMLLLLITLLIPIVYIFPKIKQIDSSPYFLFKNKKVTRKFVKNMQGMLYVRSILFMLAWFCIIVAFSGPYWGKEIIPIQKNGSAVSFVFDISWSMTAEDVLQEDSSYISRLEASKKYAKSLLLPNKTDDMVTVSVTASLPYLSVTTQYICLPFLAAFMVTE